MKFIWMLNDNSLNYEINLTLKNLHGINENKYQKPVIISFLHNKVFLRRVPIAHLVHVDWYFYTEEYVLDFLDD